MPHDVSGTAEKQGGGPCVSSSPDSTAVTPGGSGHRHGGACCSRQGRLLGTWPAPSCSDAPMAAGPPSRAASQLPVQTVCGFAPQHWALGHAPTVLPRVPGRRARAALQSTATSVISAASRPEQGLGGEWAPAAFREACG